MQEKEPNHVVFDGEKIVISPNLVDTFMFLMEISKEIETQLGFEEKILKIREKCKDILDELSQMAKFLVDQKIDYKYHITKDTLTVVEDFSTQPFPRSQMICLFAYMETIFCLVTIYNREITDEWEIIKFTNSDIRSLITTLILSDENEYYKINKDRLWKIDADKFKRLRNRLAHFYSVSEHIQIGINDQAREIENYLHETGHTEIISMSPQELYELLKSAVKLILIKRTKDSIEQPEIFAKKIWYVKWEVALNASVVIEKKNQK